jgi:hypothetical protein
MTKKDEKLVDLEYMIPKEHKEEAESTQISETEQSTLNLRESCYSCGKDSEEIVLLPVFHRGEDKWICPNCLKGHLGTEAYNAYTQPSYSSESSLGTPPETSESSSPSSESSSPMSMFD